MTGVFDFHKSQGAEQVAEHESSARLLESANHDLPAAAKAEEAKSEPKYYKYGQTHERDPRFVYPGNVPQTGIAPPGVIYPPGRFGGIIPPGYGYGNYPYPPVITLPYPHAGNGGAWGGRDHRGYGYGYGRGDRPSYGYGRTRKSY